MKLGARATFLGIFLKVAKEMGYDLESLLADLERDKIMRMWWRVND